MTTTRFYESTRLSTPPKNCWTSTWLRSLLQRCNANLRRSKIWRLSLFTTPHPPNFSRPPPLSTNWSRPRSEWVRTLYEVLHDVTYYQNSRSSFWCQNNLCQCISAYCPWNRTTNKKKSKFGGGNGLNLKLKHRKAQKMVLSGRFGNPYGIVGDRCHIPETFG